MTKEELAALEDLQDLLEAKDKRIAELESGTRRLREHLPMLEEFIYYDTIPDCHKEKLRTLIEALNSEGGGDE